MSIWKDSWPTYSWNKIFHGARASGFWLDGKVEIHVAPFPVISEEDENFISQNCLSNLAGSTLFVSIRALKHCLLIEKGMVGEISLKTLFSLISFSGKITLIAVIRKTWNTLDYKGQYALGWVSRMLLGIAFQWSHQNALELQLDLTKINHVKLLLLAKEDRLHELISKVISLSK